jgi:hypothetical protein
MKYPASDYGVLDARPTGSKLIVVTTNVISQARLNEILAKEFPDAKPETLEFYVTVTGSADKPVLAVFHKRW